MKKLRKLFRPFYDAIPLKRQLFEPLRWIKLTEKLNKFLYFKGVFSFKLEGKKLKMYNPGYQSHIENQIYWNGIENGWEKQSVKLWIGLSKRSKLILDVGANTGIFTMLSTSVNKNARVIAFEPIDFIAEKFKYNMKLNGFDYELSDYALSNTESVVEVFTESLNNSYTISIDKMNRKSTDQYTKIDIKTKRLDTIIEEMNLGKVDLMKIDVERHEPFVLEGMGKYLAEMKPDLLIEIQTDEIANEIQKLIKDIDYLFFNINDLGSVKQTTTLGKSDYLNYLICSRESAKALNLID